MLTRSFRLTKTREVCKGVFGPLVNSWALFLTDSISQSMISVDLKYLSIVNDDMWLEGCMSRTLESYQLT